MSLFTSVRQQAANITQKALRLGGDFAHPVSDDSSNGPDYAENNALAANGEISLPNTAEWAGYPTTTLIDSTTGLLTTKTEGNPPLDEGMSIYDIYATAPNAWATSRCTPTRTTPASGSPAQRTRRSPTSAASPRACCTTG